MTSHAESHHGPSIAVTSERATAAEAPFRLREWRVEPLQNRILRDSEIRELQPLLMDLLVYLFAFRGCVVSRDEILNNVWASPHVTPHALSNAISKLRKALSDDAADQSYIKTKRGVGYQLVAGAEKESPRNWIFEFSQSQPRWVVAAALASMLSLGGLIYFIASKNPIKMDYKGDAAAAIESLELEGWTIDDKSDED